MTGERFHVEIIESHHRPLRRAFSSGIDSLDVYIREQASQDMRRNVAVAWILYDRQDNLLAGYYTLSAGTLTLTSLPEELARKLPQYPAVPVIHLGRLAVDERYRGQGLGGALLVDALIRAKSPSRSTGAYAVTVDAIDDNARRFYEHYEFVSLSDDMRRLFIAMAKIEELGSY